MCIRDRAKAGIREINGFGCVLEKLRIGEELDK